MNAIIVNGLKTLSMKVYVLSMVYRWVKPKMLLVVNCSSLLKAFVDKVVNTKAQSHLNQPPTLAILLSAVRIYLPSMRGQVHMTFLKIDIGNPVLVCGPMKFLLIKLCTA